MKSLESNIIKLPKVMCDNVQSNAFKDYFAGHDATAVGLPEDFYINGYFLTKKQTQIVLNSLRAAFVVAQQECHDTEEIEQGIDVFMSMDDYFKMDWENELE